MTEYTLNGEDESGVESSLPLEGGPLEVRQAVRIEPAVRDGGPTVALEVEDDALGLAL